MIVGNLNHVQVESTYTPQAVNPGVSKSPEVDVMSYDELQAFLNQPPVEIKHPVLSSTVHNPELEQRIM